MCQCCACLTHCSLSHFLQKIGRKWKKSIQDIWDGFKGCLNSMGRNSRINIVSKCPELESISNCFLQHLPCPIFCCFWPSHHSLLVEELANPPLWVMFGYNKHTILMEIIFNYLIFSPPHKYNSPSLKLESKSTVWIHHTPCFFCPRCSQTPSTLSQLQHHEPLHISYWFLSIHSFTLTGSQHMSNLSCIAPLSSVSSKELRFAWTC